jgi:hypothetical protein
MILYNKILVVAVIFWVFNIPSTLLFFLNLNFGFPVIPFQPFIFLGLPAVVVLLKALLTNTVKLPYFKLFIFLISLFSFIEVLNRPTHETNFEFVKLISLTYTFFVLLLNISRKKIIIFYIYKISIIAISINVILALMWYLGIIDMAMDGIGVLSNQEGYFSRFGGGGVIHPNGLSFMCVIGVLLLLLNQNEVVLKLPKWVNRLLGVFFIIPIILNSSRGAFLIVSMLVLIYAFYKRKAFSLQMKILSFFLITISYFTLNIEKYIYKLNLFYRFTSQTTIKESRGQQIVQSLENFSNNILTGIGWDYAATGYSEGLTTSNFVYSQILGSSGIIVFIFFIYFQYKFFGFIKIKKNDLKVVIFCLLGFTPWMFYNLNLTFPLSIIAYLSYIHNHKTYLI